MLLLEWLRTQCTHPAQELTACSTLYPSVCAYMSTSSTCLSWRNPELLSQPGPSRSSCAHEYGYYSTASKGISLWSHGSKTARKGSASLRHRLPAGRRHAVPIVSVCIRRVEDRGHECGDALRRKVREDERACPARKIAAHLRRDEQHERPVLPRCLVEVPRACVRAGRASSELPQPRPVDETCAGCKHLIRGLREVAVRDFVRTPAIATAVSKPLTKP